MYNPNTISAFIERVNREAEQAAQAVYDKYEPEFIERVKRQMLPGDHIVVSMGTAYFENKDLDNKFLESVSEIQWTEQKAGFTTHEIEKP